MSKGFYIAIEGMDGCGKSTVIDLLRRKFENNDNVVFTREPGGCKISEEIRSIILNPENLGMDPLTEANLFNAARNQTIADVVLPSIKEGKLVISDRSMYSSVVYQGAAKNVGIDTIIDINKRVKVPDRLYVITIDPNIARERLVKTNSMDRYDNESVDFFTKVSDAYGHIHETIFETPIDTHVMFVNGNHGSEVVMDVIYKDLKEQGVI